MSKQQGLSAKDVEERIAKGQHNNYEQDATKTTKTIIRENTMTLFNLLNFVLAFLLLLVGAYSNMAFILIIIVNIVIGIVQEIRARNMIQKLTLITQKRITTIREGEEVSLRPAELVLDDIVVLSTGDQVPADMVVIEGDAEVNESLLTGEADAIEKTSHSHLLSGSFLTSGQVICQVEHVGAENYATKLINETKEERPIQSELLASIRSVSQFTSYVIIPLGAIMFLEALVFRGDNIYGAVVSTVAALIGMLPKGLVLLISLALTTGVLKLAKKQVLTQNMYAIEMLAHTDVICLDKTGTLTEGKMQVEGCYVLGDCSQENFDAIMGSYLLNQTDNNVTTQALKHYFSESTQYQVTDHLAFSSSRKWAAVTLDQIGSIYLGAPERLLDKANMPSQIEELQKQGLRVLVLGQSPNAISPDRNQNPITPLGLITLSDPVRDSAPQTLAFFKEQGLEVKVISGDNPVTVSKIAHQAGVENANEYIDLSDYQDEETIRTLIHNYTVFGRVSPDQKKLLVSELRSHGKTVAMTGDGVNDVLALREADVSIAMAEGDGATRQISDLVLLESDFQTLPEVIYEGRRVVNNITRSAGVFFIKTLYSFLITALCVVTGMTFPFIPIQITLIDAAIEGYPSFVTSFEPDKKKITAPFLANSLARALPAAILVVWQFVAVKILELIGIIAETQSTALLYYLLVGVSCLSVLRSLCPYNPLRVFIAITTVVGTYAAVILFGGILHVAHLELFTFVLFLIMMALTTVGWWLLFYCLDDFQSLFERLLSWRIPFKKK